MRVTSVAAPSDSHASLVTPPRSPAVRMRSKRALSVAAAGAGMGAPFAEGNAMRALSAGESLREAADMVLRRERKGRGQRPGF